MTLLTAKCKRQALDDLGGDGSFRLYLHGDVHKVSATQVGDRVNVEVGFDAAYRSGPQPLPSWFLAALAKDPIAMDWQALPPSRQKEIVRYFSALKSAAARERNLARALQALAGRPAGSWRDPGAKGNSAPGL